MRKLMTRGALAAALALGGLGGLAIAGTASADPAHVTARTGQEARTPERMPTVVPPGYEFYDDYWSNSGCREAGLSGVSQGNWKAWHCEESAIDWNLWVKY